MSPAASQKRANAERTRDLADQHVVLAPDVADRIGRDIDEGGAGRAQRQPLLLQLAVADVQELQCRRDVQGVDGPHDLAGYRSVVRPRQRAVDQQRAEVLLLVAALAVRGGLDGR